MNKKITLTFEFDTIEEATIALEMFKDSKNNKKCNHRKEDGTFSGDDTKDGLLKCTQCGAIFFLQENLDDEVVALNMRNMVDIIESAKVLNPNINSTMSNMLSSIDVGLVKQIPNIYKVAKEEYIRLLNKRP